MRSIFLNVVFFQGHIYAIDEQLKLLLTFIKNNKRRQWNNPRSIQDKETAQMISI